VSRANISIENLYHGGLRIMAGLFKKVALADFLGLTVAEVSYVATPLHAWKVVLAYSLQIYLDFSAYSDIAIGLSRLMGIRVPENFRAPYLSENIQEFWNRWHISLSSWVRDYIFMEVGRRLFKTHLRSRSTVVAAACYLTTFTVIGAWHGLTPNFLVWGVYHGLLLVGYHLYKTWLPTAVVTHRLYQSRAGAWAGIGLTFFFVTVGWVLFMVDLPKGLNLLHLMFRL
jgi:alginate O-acetyltransferase complex protein AlgI